MCTYMTGLPCDLDHPVRMYVAMSGSRELNYNGTKEGYIVLPAVLRCAFGCESTEPVPLAQMNTASLQRVLGFHLPVGNLSIEKVQFSILTVKGVCVRAPKNQRKL